MTADGMERGHSAFLNGLGISIIGFIVIIMALAVASLNPASPLGNILVIYAGAVLSAAGGVLMIVGIHIFMQGTIGAIGKGLETHAAESTELDHRPEKD